MSESTRNRLLIAALVVMAGLLVVLVASNPNPEDRVARLGASIMCPVCQGESIGSSPAPMARDMMVLVGERVAAGVSDAEIIDEILSSYSGALLLDPPVSGPTLVLWLAPAVALVAGIGVIIWWRRQPPVDNTSEQPSPSRNRRAIGALGLLAAGAVVVVTVGFFLNERDNPGGVAGLGDPDQYSNETMEAVIAANLDNPAISGMRLALADRYFQEGDYRSAFPHYFEVAASNSSSPEEVAAALVGLGWMTWDGNREADTALGLFDQALAINPGSVTARYLKARVLWCGPDDIAGATELFDSILSEEDISADARVIVEDTRAELQNGEGCE